MAWRNGEVTQRTRQEGVGEMKAHNDMIAYGRLQRRMKVQDIFTCNKFQQYIGDPFNERAIKGMKDKFLEHPYLLNVHILLREPTRGLSDNGSKQRITGELIGQMFLVPKIMHVLFASHKGITVESVKERDDCVRQIEYMFLFFFGPVTLDTTRHSPLDPSYKHIFDLGNGGDKQFDGKTITAWVQLLPSPI